MTKLIEIRCPSCNKKLCDADGKVSIKCPRCKKIVIVDTHKVKPKQTYDTNTNA